MELGSLVDFQLGTVAVQRLADIVQMLYQLLSVGETRFHLTSRVVSRSEFVYKEFSFLVCSATLGQFRVFCSMVAAVVSKLLEGRPAVE